ncbi:transglutaminase domain-containing protein [Cellulosilyticum sp. I15G10I2]|uniref:transglutaminase domain-containing protein n=1 Tax=Cellulosilyticum sp. I15G10I2 TaxID=1892843 RepID=UPI00085CA477|nr:transglutaminase domain-containing protein [Cellulosilyticum sp. I15G10I2]
MNKLKIKVIVLTLLLSLVISPTVYAKNYTAKNFKEYTEFLLRGMSDYKEVITIHYLGNEKFLKTEIGSQLHKLYNESAQNLSTFDKQNIYSIRMLSAEQPVGKKQLLRIAQYEIQYKNSAQELQEVDLIVNDVLKQITAACQNDYKTIEAIYNYVLKTYRYEKMAVDDTDTENILLERNLLNGLKGTNGVVCDAYVMLLSKMLTAKEIENVIVMGTAYGELHVWNKVKLNGNWYNIDPTWGDSIYSENKAKYFLTSDQVLLHNGRVWHESDYPASPNSYTIY